MKPDSTFRRGDQIVYVPSHAQHKLPSWSAIPWTFDVECPDIEFGFVAGWNDEFVFCRFWRNGQPGVLRTTANSEATPRNCLVKYISVEQDQVEATLRELGYTAEPLPIS